MLGQGADHEADLKRLERYEAACSRRLQWALERLRNRNLPRCPRRHDPGNGGQPDVRGMPARRPTR